jgi:hypothetical protein
MPLDNAPTGVRENVSKTHLDLHFAQSTAFARRLCGRVALRNMRSHFAIQMFIAALGLAVREARRNPEIANAACHKAGVKAKRLEVRIARLVVGKRIRARQDQIARWANAAAYIAHPPNGDVPPADWRDATRYIIRRGGLRRLSNLYAHRRDGKADRSARQATFYDEPGENTTQEWYTPEYIFDALGCEFDLDPASPGRDLVPWIPAHCHFTSDGLERDWFGFVWLNPPYGRGVLPLWVEKFADHGNGIALVPERTSTAWWQALVSRADMILCVKSKIPFSNAAGERTSAFPIGSTLVAIGDNAVKGLIRGYHNGLGILLIPAPQFRVERASQPNMAKAEHLHPFVSAD